MQCERLRKLIRGWSNQIVDDALAPARMVEFVGRHIKTCAVCQADPTLSTEPSKIKKMLVPSISARDPQKAARFEEILEHYSGYEENPGLEEKMIEQETDDEVQRGQI